MDTDASAMRDSLKLDFNNTAQQLQPPVSAAMQSTGDLLSAILKSPTFAKIQRDLVSDFKSPTLEMIQRDLLSEAALKVLPTPTPTKMLYPVEVSQEQAQYAQGFIDALRHVQQMNGFKPLHSPSVLAGATSFTSPQPSPVGCTTKDFDAIVQAIQLAQEKEKREREAESRVTLPAALLPGIVASTSSPTSSSHSLPSIFPMAVDVKPDLGLIRAPSAASLRASSEESDFSDRSSSQPSSSGARRSNTRKDLSGMDEQDVRKLERKRARNRAAASKCRQKKLARISELEQQVQMEREQQNKLDFQLKMLKDEMMKLENQIGMHQSHGCAVRQ